MNLSRIGLSDIDRRSGETVRTRRVHSPRCIFRCPSPFSLVLSISTARIRLHKTLEIHQKAQSREEGLQSKRPVLSSLPFSLVYRIYVIRRRRSEGTAGDIAITRTSSGWIARPGADFCAPEHSCQSSLRATFLITQLANWQNRLCPLGLFCCSLAFSSDRPAAAGLWDVLSPAFACI